MQRLSRCVTCRSALACHPASSAASGVSMTCCMLPISLLVLYIIYIVRISLRYGIVATSQQVTKHDD